MDVGLPSAGRMSCMVPVASGTGGSPRAGDSGGTVRGTSCTEVGRPSAGRTSVCASAMEGSAKKAVATPKPNAEYKNLFIISISMLRPTTGTPGWLTMFPGRRMSHELAVIRLMTTGSREGLGKSAKAWAKGHKAGQEREGEREGATSIRYA